MKWRKPWIVYSRSIVYSGSVSLLPLLRYVEANAPYQTSSQPCAVAHPISTFYFLLSTFYFLLSTFYFLNFYFCLDDG